MKFCLSSRVRMPFVVMKCKSFDRTEHNLFRKLVQLTSFELQHNIIYNPLYYITRDTRKREEKEDNHNTIM